MDQRMTRPDPGRSATVLRDSFKGYPKLLGRTPDPARVIEKSAGDRDMIGMTIRERTLGLSAVKNHPDSTRHDA